MLAPAVGRHHAAGALRHVRARELEVHRRRGVDLGLGGGELLRRRLLRLRSDEAPCGSLEQDATVTTQSAERTAAASFPVMRMGVRLTEGRRPLRSATCDVGMARVGDDHGGTTRHLTKEHEPMALLGVILMLVGAGAGVVTYLATHAAAGTIAVSAFGFTRNATALELVVYGAVAVLLFALGWALVSAAARRRVRVRREEQGGCPPHRGRGERRGRSPRPRAPAPGGEPARRGPAPP